MKDNVQEVKEALDQAPTQIPPKLNRKQKRLVRDLEELQFVQRQIAVFEKITTALPKKKEARYGKILKPLYARNSLLKFNISQSIK